MKNFQFLFIVTLILNAHDLCYLSLKTSKFDSIQISSLPKISFTQFIGLESSNSMATSLYSFIQTSLNIGKELNEILQAIINMKNGIENDFRINQQIFRNNKLNLSKNLNEKILILKSLKEKSFNLENQKKIIKINYELNKNYREKIQNYINFSSEKVQNELKEYENLDIGLKLSQKKNEIIISLSKSIEKIILNEDRVPDINFKISYEIGNDGNNSVNFIFNSHENSLFNLNLIFNDVDKGRNDTQLVNIDGNHIEENNLQRFKNLVMYDEAFVSLETILKFRSYKFTNMLNIHNEIHNSDDFRKSIIHQNPNESRRTLKEKIINILSSLINSKEKENLKLSEKRAKLKTNCDNLKNKLEKFTEIFLMKIKNIDFVFDIKNNEEFQDKINFLDVQESLLERSIKSTVEDIEFYSKTFKEEEANYSSLVERTKYYVKAINQIKKFLINNFNDLKEFLRSRFNK